MQKKVKVVQKVHLATSYSRSLQHKYQSLKKKNPQRQSTRSYASAKPLKNSASPTAPGSGTLP